MCSDAEALTRVHGATADCGLVVGHRYVVTPRARRPPLFTVWALRPGAATTPSIERQLTLRDEAGERTEHAKMIRAFSGLPEHELTGVDERGFRVERMELGGADVAVRPLDR